MFYPEHNRALETMRSGGFALGLQLRSRSPLIAELSGYLGFDFLYIETEHFSCTDETLEGLVRAAQVTDITTWVRVTDTNAENIGHILDIGAQGIIAPHLETAEEAKRFVDAVKFPPIGHRGASSTSRAACYGCMPAGDFIAASNRNCSAIGMIETMNAVENLDAILDSGLDMIRVGRNDLSMDMGLYGKQDDPRFTETLRKITAKARAHGIPAGTGATDEKSAQYFQSLGFQYLTIASDLDYLKRNLPILLTSIRGALEGRD